MNWIDSIIGAFDPQAGLRRVMARRALDRVRELNAGKSNRLTKSIGARPSSGEIKNWTEVAKARQNAWYLYRNNPYARKIVDTVIAQTVGCGLNPEPQSVKPNGDADLRFRDGAKMVWHGWADENKFKHQCCQILRESILSGELLVHRKKDSSAPFLPYRLEIIEAERLVEDAIYPARVTKLPDKNYIYRGIEFDSTGRRVAYHVYDWHPEDPRPHLQFTETTRIPADEIIHLYRQDRPGQIRGYSWMAPILLQLNDINEYQENELIAAKVGACVVAAITSLPGSGVGSFGLNTPSGGETVDEDGNTINWMQPGMFIKNLRPGEKIEGFNPQRPNSQAEAFITHLLRGLSNGMPGIKSSTITGDYRKSSYSSEKSADNDSWRETEQVQEWLCDMLCQPVYEDVVTASLLTNTFPIDKRTFSLDSFEANRRYYLKAAWSGPVAASINPTDDENASKLAMENGTSSLQIECAARGRRMEDVLADQKAEMELRQTLGLPDRRTAEVEAMTQPEPAPPARRLYA